MRTGSTGSSPKLNTEQYKVYDQECRDERSMALQLGAQHSEVEAFARTLAAENRQHEFARAELRTSFDENRAQMIHYLGEEFEQKL